MRKIHGVGAVTARRMEDSGLKTIADLQALPEQALVARFGKFGHRLAHFAHGEDDRRVTPDRPTKSISAETTFRQDTGSAETLREIASALSERVAAQLARKGLAGRSVVLKLKTSDFRILTRSRSLAHPTQRADIIFESVAALIGKEADGRTYRLIGVGIGDLGEAASGRPHGPVQLRDRWRNSMSATFTFDRRRTLLASWRDPAHYDEQDIYIGRVTSPIGPSGGSAPPAERTDKPYVADRTSLERPLAAVRRPRGRYRLGYCQHRHGDHHHRHSVGACGVQHRRIHAAAFRFKAVSRDDHFGRGDAGTGVLGVIGNVVWLVLAGWWLALGHLLFAAMLAITIIGLPFAWAHLKLAGIALWPIGKAIVAADDAPLRYPPPRRA